MSGSSRDKGSDQIGNIRQQIGETLATVQSLKEQQIDVARSVRASADAMARDVSAMKHEMRNWQQAISGRQELLQTQVALLEQRMTGVEKGVADLKSPVDELVTLRRRMGALGFMMFSLLTVVWAVTAPVWTAFVNRLLPWTLHPP